MCFFKNMTKKTYIVLDLEWNQSPDGKEYSVPGIPFEIIELGAYKLNENHEIIDSFHRVIRPVVYKKIHFKVHEVVHIGIHELRKLGVPFAQAAEEFFDWCGLLKKQENPVVFCTWGSMDLTEFQRNMKYHLVENTFPYPLLYYDIQKLYNLLYPDPLQDRYPLEKAVEKQKLTMDRGFHHALDDAYYTAKIMKSIDFSQVGEYLSLDYYTLPKNEEEELYLDFPGYSKYVSMLFASKEEVIENKTVTDIVCNCCHRMLKKKIRWFSSNQRNYFGMGICPQHGYVQGKIRIRSREGRYFVIKTMKGVDERAYEELLEKKEDYKQKRNERNRQKKIRTGDGL